MKNFNKSQASSLIERFEELIADSFHTVATTVADFNLAASLLQNPHAGFRAGDALHLAIAQNHGAKRFYTLDQTLGKAAKELTSLVVVV